MIIVDSSIPPTTYPRQPYQVLGGLGEGSPATTLAIVGLTGAALLAIHHFIRKPNRRGR